MIVDRALAAEIAVRINRYGIGPWLLALLDQLGLPVPDGLAAPRTRVTLTHDRAGLELVLYRREKTGVPGWADALVLERARLTPPQAALPYRLDEFAETFATAQTKLSINHTGPGTRVSYFLDEARVVELTFVPGGSGLTSVLLAALGSELPFP